MAKVTVRMGVDVDGLAVHLISNMECDNPLFYATAVKSITDELEEKIINMVAATFGDIGRTE